MKRLFCFFLCLCLLSSFIPSSFAVYSKEKILFDIDPMLDEQDYAGIISYFTLVKNESHTIPGATKPFILKNTLILPANLTEIDDEAFAFNAQIDAVVIPDTVTKIADNAFSGIDNLTIIANEGFYPYSWAISNGYEVSSLPHYPDEFSVTITNENFKDYFEIVSLPHYNSFGEKDGLKRIGVKSKLYDLGYVIKGDIDYSIVVELKYRESGSTYHYDEFSLYDLAWFGSLNTVNKPEYSFRRIVSGDITFINKNLVKSYVLDKNSLQPDSYDATITLQNGVLLKRTVVDGYLY